MGLKGNCNRYGFLVLVHLLLDIGYGVLGLTSGCSSNPSSLNSILQAFVAIHILSIILGYYNRKYIFGTKEIVTYTSSWREEITYYSGRKEYKTHASTTFEKTTIPFTFIFFTGYVGLFIAFQVIIFSNWNYLNSLGGCNRRLIGLGCALIILTYIITITTIIILRRYYRSDIQNNASSGNQQLTQIADNNKH